MIEYKLSEIEVTFNDNEKDNQSGRNTKSNYIKMVLKILL